jgi:hypothetical protein
MIGVGVDIVVLVPLGIVLCRSEIGGSVSAALWLTMYIRIAFMLQLDSYSIRKAYVARWALMDCGRE